MSAWARWWDNALFAFMENVFVPIMALMLLALIGGLVLFGVVMYEDSNSPTFALRKDQWACAASHKEFTTTYVMSGKVMVPFTSETSVCDQWNKKP